MSKTILTVRELKQLFDRLNTYYNDNISHAVPLTVGAEVVELLTQTEGVKEHAHAQLLALVAASESTKQFIYNVNAPGVLETYQKAITIMASQICEDGEIDLAEVVKSFNELGSDVQGVLEIVKEMVAGNAKLVDVETPDVLKVDDEKTHIKDVNFDLNKETGVTYTISKTENVQVNETDTHIEIKVDKFPDVDSDDEDKDPEFEIKLPVTSTEITETKDDVDSDDEDKDPEFEIKLPVTPDVEEKPVVLEEATEEVANEISEESKDEETVIQKPDTNLGIEVIRNYTITKGQKTKLTNLLKGEDMECLLDDIVAGEELELETELAEKVKEFLTIK